jgi:hypothetical protein
MSDERRQVAAEIRRVREAVQGEDVPARSPEEVLGSPRQTPTPTAHPLQEAAAAQAPVPRAPDAAAVNETWDTGAALARGGRLARLLRRALAPALEAQVTFNSRQVQLDNELLAFLVARLEAIHRQYDGVLGIHGQHMQDIDTRHLILQEELVAHVHDLVRRIDLTLSEAERTRLSLESELRELRARVVELEAQLGGR